MSVGFTSKIWDVGRVLVSRVCLLATGLEFHKHHNIFEPGFLSFLRCNFDDAPTQLRPTERDALSGL